MKKFLFLPLLLITCLCFAQDAKDIIGKPIKIGNLLVAQNDFPEAMQWADAKSSCKALGIGWRLPTKTELNILYNNRKKLGKVSDWEGYWTSSAVPSRLWDPKWTPAEIGEGIAWRQYFTSGIQGYASMSNDKCVVRAVKSL
jgi:hypothetical protein